MIRATENVQEELPGIPLDVEQWTEESEAGFVSGMAESVSEWAEALIKILSSRHLQSEFGEAGRLAVEQTYSLQVQAPVLAEILRSVAQRGNS